MDEDEARKAKRDFEIGADLDPVSVEELGERIEILRAEIARMEAAIAAKKDQRSAADALFS